MIVYLLAIGYKPVSGYVLFWNAHMTCVGLTALPVCAQDVLVTGCIQCWALLEHLLEVQRGNMAAHCSI